MCNGQSLFHCILGVGYARKLFPITVDHCAMGFLHLLFGNELGILTCSTRLTDLVSKYAMVKCYNIFVETKELPP